METYILIATENEEEGKKLAKFLEDHDYEVTVNSSDEALELIMGPSNGWFDLVIVIGEAVHEAISLLVSLAGKAGLPCLFLSELPNDLEEFFAMTEATFEAAELFAKEETDPIIRHGVGIALGRTNATGGCLQPREAPDG